MADITTRELAGGNATVKGEPLTNSEVDANFISLDTGKAEVSALSAEAEARASADTALDEKIDAIEQYDDTDLAASLAAETQARIDGDAEVSGNLETEVDARRDADSALQTQVNGLVEEADLTGLIYGRANGTWVQITGGDGGDNTGGAGSINLAYDKLTPNGTVDTFNLTISGNAREPLGATNMLVSVNGVIQEPGAAFTTSGSTITFAEVPQTDDVIDFIVELTNGSHWELNGVNLEYAGEGSKVIVDQFQANGGAVFMGLVGIGEDNPNAKLHVDNGGSGDLLNLTGQLGSITSNKYGNTLLFSRPDSNYISASGIGANLQISAQSFLRFETNGSEAMRIDSLGHVFVKDDANGDLRLGEVNDIPGLYSGDGKGMMFRSDVTNNANLFVWKSGSTDRMVLDSSGNLGIGMTPDTATFDLTAKEQLKEWKTRAKASTWSEVTDGEFSQEPTEDLVAQWIEARAAGDAKLQVSGGGYFSGNVGIGETNPQQTLHVNGGLQIQGNISTPASGTEAAHVDYFNNNMRFWSRGTATTRGTFEFIQLESDGQNQQSALVIDSSGSLLVGTTTSESADYPLQLNRTGQDCFARIISTGNVYGRQSGVSIKHQDTLVIGSLAVFARGSGLASTYLNLANNDGSAPNSYTYQNSGVLRISSTVAHIGTTSGTVVGTQTSDERLKDIEPSFEYGLDAVMALKPIAYTRNDEDSPVRQLGFGAQTTQAIVPEAVYDTGECLDGYDVNPDDSMVQTAKSDDTKLAMAYVQIVPVLVKAMQEQQAMIETLQAEVAALMPVPEPEVSTMPAGDES